MNDWGVVRVVRVPEWERYGWLRHGWSLRTGGHSQVYGQDELNLGFTREDYAETVRRNRVALARAVGGEGMEGPVTVRQVHGVGVRRVSRADVGQPAGEADGVMTDEAGVLVGVMTADCTPVLVADTRLRVVGAFHAGWRGTAARMAESGVTAMRESFGCRVEDLVAGVGPAIGPCCYAVGDKVRAAFGPEGVFAEGDELRLDLWETNRRQLVRAGVKAERVWVAGECSACAREADGRRRYFSHRAEKGVTGRGMGVIGVARG